MPFSLGIPKKATSPLIAFKERIWIASPEPTSTIPKDPSPRCSPTVETSTGAATGGAVVTGGAVAGAAVGAGAAVVAAGAASSAASEPQAPAISVKATPSASNTRLLRRIVNPLQLGVKVGARSEPCFIGMRHHRPRGRLRQTQALVDHGNQGMVTCHEVVVADGTHLWLLAAAPVCRPIAPGPETAA